jgi:hypothetical protein
MRIRIRRTALLGLLLGLLLMLGLPIEADAGAVPATLGIRPGPLYITYTQQNLTVVDATGSGDGWHVLASSSGIGSGSVRVIPAWVPACAPGSTCTLPRVDTSYPVTVTSSPVTIATALPGTGMGTIMTGLAMEITGDATVSLQVVSGP